MEVPRTPPGLGRGRWWACLGARPRGDAPHPARWPGGHTGLHVCDADCAARTRPFSGLWASPARSRSWARWGHALPTAGPGVSRAFLPTWSLESPCRPVQPPTSRPARAFGRGLSRSWGPAWSWPSASRVPSCVPPCHTPRHLTPLWLQPLPPHPRCLLHRGRTGRGAETQPPRPAPVWLRCISLCGFAHDRRFGVCRAQGHGCHPAAGVPGMWLLACGKGAPEGQPGPRAAARRAGRGGGSGPCLHGEPGRCVVSDRWMLKVAISAVEQGSRGKGAVGGAGSFV